MGVKSRTVLATVAVLGMAAAAIVPAKAEIMTKLTGVGVNADGSYTYTYGATLTRGSELQGTQTDFGVSPDHPIAQFGTVYDFGPLLSGTTVSFGNSSSVLARLFTFSFDNLSNPQSLNTSVPDSESLMNIRFTYAAPNHLVYNANDTATPLNGTSTAESVTGDNSLGTFSVVSAFAPGLSNNLRYDSSTYNTSNYTPQGANGLVDGPDSSLAVPEPASLAVLGMGLLGLGVARRRKMV